MISFSVLNEENIEEVTGEMSKGLSPDEISEVLEISEQLCQNDDPDLEYAVAVSCGCLLVRVFDMGRYSFMFPFGLSEEADFKGAVLNISEYAMREEIGLSFFDVPSECISVFSGYRHINLDAEDADSTSYRVTVKGECELLDEIPEVEVGRVKLNALTENDISKFAELSRDENVNKFWGYDYRDDVKNPEDEYFFNTQREEYIRGVSMSCAVRFDGEFIGEAIFYAFDGMGGCEFALRLLPKWQGKGLSLLIKDAIIVMARKIGLVKLSARIMKDNKASVAFASKFMKKESEDESSVIFLLGLYE